MGGKKEKRRDGLSCGIERYAAEDAVCVFWGEGEKGYGRERED